MGESASPIERAANSGPRCPRCMQHATEWCVDTPKDPTAKRKEPELRCSACKFVVAPAKRDPQSWEEDAEKHLTAWDPFIATYGLERRAQDEDVALDRAIAARTPARDTEYVAELVSYVRAELPATARAHQEMMWQEERGLVTELAKWLFSGRTVSAEMVRRFNRREPNRSPFATLGAALRYRARGTIGMSPVNLSIAETRWEKPAPVDADGETDLAVLRLRKAVRRVGGIRGGQVHATSSSHNGSVGDAKNQASIGLALDIARAIERAMSDSLAEAKRTGAAPALTEEELRALQVMHDAEPEEGAREKPDRQAAMVSLLVAERLLRGDEPHAVVKVVVASNRHRLAGRLARATEALEHALRALPDDGDDENGVPRLEGMVPLLRPAAERVERGTRPMVAARPVALGFGFGVGVGA